MAHKRRPVYKVFEGAFMAEGVEIHSQDYTEKLLAFSQRLADAGVRVDGAGEVAYTPVAAAVKYWMRGARSEFIHAQIGRVADVFSAPHPWRTE